MAGVASIAPSECILVSRHDFDDSFALKPLLIAGLALGAIVTHLLFRFGAGLSPVTANLPLFVALAGGGVPLVYDLARKAWRREFGSDLLAGMSIVVSVLLGEYLAGTLVVLMLSGGEAIESYALGRAASVLRALANRLPTVAHRARDGGPLEDIPIDAVQVGDRVVIFPHEIAPVDGEVLEGHGVMDESYLTGEPFMMSKTPGSQVLSGAVNGEAALTIRATKLAVDSRYARIMQVMEEAERNRPPMRRLADRLGAWYTPVAVGIASLAWLASGDPVRFLAVLVIATPCPLLIAIPVAIIGAISRAARRGIIIRDPAALEQLDRCQTIILDKTGTLTRGRPELTEQIYADGFSADDVLPLVTAVEHYSKHPLALAIVRAGRAGNVMPLEVSEISEPPGRGLTGLVQGHRLEITGRGHLEERNDPVLDRLPPHTSGLECVVLVDGSYAGTFRFHDAPRADSAPFIAHLGPKHRVTRILLVSGDREAEVRYLADRVQIDDIRAGVSPEGKVKIVREETARSKTLFVGDGINDAPALLTATVGVAFGKTNEITSEAGKVVIVDTSLAKVDELLHIGQRLRRVALQSALGGMAMSIVGMVVAALGYLPPVAGALTQEVIDLVVVFNALRTSISPRTVIDYPSDEL